MEREDTSSDAAGGIEADASPAAAGREEGKKRAVLSKKLLARVAAVAVVVSITATIFVFRDEVADLQSYGYLGAFLISLITTATVVLPVPGLALIFALGYVYDPILIGLAAGAGSALGEITGYMAGFSGQLVAENAKWYSRVEQWMRRRGAIVIFVFSLVPNPFFDLAGAIAGVLRYPLWKFLVFCFLGKTPKNMLVAFAGAYAMEGVLNFFEKHF